MTTKLNLAGCVILKGNSILLLHRTKRDWYELPGGKVDENESVKEAAIREIKEELCCEVELHKHLGTKDFNEDGYTMNYVWYLAGVKENHSPSVGEPDKFSHCKFIPLEELSKHNLSPNMKNLVEEMKKGTINLKNG
tara:strand:+ start:121 stop:531 length:411 start_codon:yes stop_codon:yes gene_type:complete